MEKSLTEHRQRASDLSLGASHKVIYSRAVELLKEKKASAKHLDFGSGQGLFLKILLDELAGVDLTGIDLMAKPKSLADSITWVVQDLNKELELTDNSFNSISALEIIEHLENPRHVFRELYRILNPGGCLVLSTPNNESWRSILSFMKRGHFVAFTDRDYPAHITPLNRKDLLRIAQESGFQFDKWAYSAQGCIPGITQLSWQGVSLGVLKGLRYSDNLFLVLRK